MAERKRERAATDAWGALLRVHASLVPQLDRALQAAHRLPLAWYDVLLELRYAPDHRLRMTELGERVTLSRTRVSRLVDELVVAGLVRREANADDRRSAYAALTPQGRSTFEEAAPTYLRGIMDLFAAGLTAAELAAVRDALRKVTRHAAGRTPA
jgi:DNA-binding MarR family transcriptional regulator